METRRGNRKQEGGIGNMKENKETRRGNRKHEGGIGNKKRK